MSENNFRPSTLCIHGGQQVGNNKERAVPISQTTSFLFADAAEAAALFNVDRAGYIYTRLNNPTSDVLEQRLAQLDGGVAALAFSSGMAAITAAILNIAGAGDHIVSSASLYGGTVTLFAHTLKRLGIEFTFVDVADPTNVANAIRPNTRAVFLESVGNPKNDVPDFRAIADIAHKANVPVICDNTIMTPIHFRGFDHGIDINIYSCTKFIGGHGTSIGGAIVDSGKFNWANGRYPELTEPDASYHGMKYVEKFGAAAYIVKARLQLLRDTGGCISPFNAWLLLQGLETLHLRMPAHSANTEAVTKWMKSHPRISWVNSVALPDHPSHANAKKYFTGFSSVFGFGVKGGYEAAKQFIDATKLCSHLANIGDSKTLVIHPASTTHQQLSSNELKAAGISDDFIRISIGTEHVDDILADIDQALAAATR